MTNFELTTDIKEEDYEPLFIIDWHCFYDFPEIAAFFPGGLDPTQREANVKSVKVGVFGYASVQPGVYAKVLDSTSNEIAAFISCRIYAGPRGILDGPFKPGKTKLPRIEDPEDRKFYEWYWTTIEEKLHAIKEFQVPHLHLHVIGTDPKWQRRGVGAMMMAWYVEYARKAGIGRCALYAGPFAAEIGFYEKFGFQRGETITMVDEDQFPGRKGTPGVVMFKDV